MDTETKIIHLDWSEREKVQIPEELLQSLASALVPDFQAYVRDKQSRVQEGQNID